MRLIVIPTGVVLNTSYVLKRPVVVPELLPKSDGKQQLKWFELGTDAAVARK